MTSIQVALLYIQLYIPFVAVFWLNFSNDEVRNEIKNLTITGLDNFDHWNHIKNDTESLIGLNNVVS